MYYGDDNEFEVENFISDCVINKAEAWNTSGGDYELFQNKFNTLVDESLEFFHTNKHKELKEIAYTYGYDPA